MFKLLGVFSAQSAWLIFTIDSLFSALTVPAIWELAVRCFDRKVAVWSSWIWALYPAAMQYAVRWVWDTSLTTFLFAWVLVVTLRLRARSAEDPGRSTALWVCFGALWGLAGLSNPAILIFLPACGLWILGGFRNAQRQSRGVMLAALLFMGCFGPWVVRNWLAFHAFVPTRANFGAELYLGNGPGATGLLMEYDHPIQAPDQLRLYSALGEVAYAQLRGAQARAAIEANPGLFLRNTLKRMFFFWGGRAASGQPHPMGGVRAQP